MFIRLETVKKNRWLLDEFGGYPTRYQCRQHGEQTYSRPGNSGYTEHYVAAGVWSFREAFELVKHCCEGKRIVFKVEGIPYEELVQKLRNPETRRAVKNGVDQEADRGS